MKARITVDARTPGHTIDRRIYGHFIENMGRCTYGGVLRNSRPGNPRGPWGVNETVAEMAEALRPPVIRWPGGLYADGYHWRDGVGPVSSRPTGRNRYWSRYGPFLGFVDPNAFGPDEFMEYANRMGAEPYLNVNYGTGSAAEAAGWVKYMNSGPDKHAGRLRAGFGHERPWGVKTWGIGNEIYGPWSLGHTKPAEYARRYLEFKGAMEEADPGLEYVAVGADHYFSKSWNREVLSVAAGDIDLLAVHVYLPGPERIAGVGAAKAMGGSARLYRSIVASPIEYERRLRLAVEDIESVDGPESAIGIAFDEWNLWWSLTQLRLPLWTLRDALFACGVFHAMVRLARRVRMANVAQLVNVLGVITTLGDRTCRTSLYYPFLLYAEHGAGNALGVKCACDTFESAALGGIPRMTNVPVLDCVATASPDGEIALFVINRHPERDLPCSIELAGASPAGSVGVEVLNGPDVNARNTFQDDSVVGIDSRVVDAGDVLPVHTFPAHSATMLLFKK